MKFIIDNWMLISLAVVSGALLLAPVIQGAASKGLSAAEAVQSAEQPCHRVPLRCQGRERHLLRFCRVVMHIVGGRALTFPNNFSRFIGAFKSFDLVIRGLRCLLAAGRQVCAGPEKHRKKVC